MANWRELQAQRDEMLQQFQSDVDASVVYYDEPDGNGMCWDVTMPREEYLARRGQIGDLYDAIQQAQQSEQDDITVDRFLYGE